MELNIIESLEKLLFSYTGHKSDKIVALPPSGSYRKYYRIWCKDKTYIGAYNEDRKENNAFVSFTSHFIQLGLNVPELYASNLDENVYLLQDLGDITLLSYIERNTDEDNFSGETIAIYKKVLSHLPLFQVNGGRNIDFSVGYPRFAFDRQSMMWDLNYFKYYFLKLAKVPFDEQKLEDDFQRFVTHLLESEASYFLYRDFQSRNVMIVDGEPYFIDYQGGRRGALQYDIASILFEAKTSLPPNVREILLNHYLDELSKHLEFDRTRFMKYFYSFVYIRQMQAMGAYGFRGLYEKKELFLQSIPKALNHLAWLRANVKLSVAFPELEKVWDHLVASEYIKHLANNVKHLTISINSFSYRRGIPVDEKLNGGGFVFDCRALNNPGRYDQYKTITGKDAPVIEYLKDDAGVKSFLSAVFMLVDSSIDKYLEKDYSNLMVNFGCTGGQHRSVYSAEQLAAHIKEKYPSVQVSLRHRELEMKK